MIARRPLPKTLVVLLWVVGLGFALHFLPRLILPDYFYYREYWPSGAIKVRDEKIHGSGIGMGSAIFDGEARSWYENGQLSFKGNYRADQFDGIQTWYNQQGKVIDRWTYSNGVPADGHRLAYWPNGKLRDDISYLHGKMNGRILNFCENGMLEKIRVYKLGILEDGTWSSYWDNGKIKFRFSMVDGKKSGLENYWLKDGKMGMQCSYVSGVLEGPAWVLFADGTSDSMIFDGGKAILAERFYKSWRDKYIFNYKKMEGTDIAKNENGVVTGSSDIKLAAYLDFSNNDISKIEKLDE